MSTITDITMYQGEAYQFPDTIIGDTGEPLNIADWSLTFTLKDTFNTPLITKSVGSGMVITNPTQGEVTVYLNATDTSNTPPGLYSWSISRTDLGAEAVVSNGALSILAR